jgi:hypothetical protein
VKALTPVQSLVLLLLAGFGLAGWIYGVHWKRVASGDLFTGDEKHIIRLQDQIERLTQENDSLHLRLRKLESGEEPAPSSASSAASVPAVPAVPDPVVLPASGAGPQLPPRPQKIETH